MTSVSSVSATVLFPTCKGPLEAPRSPTVGPVETQHLYPVRLSRLEKVGSAMVTLRASQGQRKWGNRSQQQMKTPTSPDLFLLSADNLCCSAVAALHVRRGFYSRFIYKRIKNGKMRLEGKRHVFSGSDSVERLWPSRGAEYAALYLCTSSQSVGSLPVKRPVVGWCDFFHPHRGFYSRTTFQRESGWSSSHTTPDPPDRFHGIRNNRLK